jgi:hypothetical protein
MLSLAARGNPRFTRKSAGKDACPTWHTYRLRTTVAQASLPAAYCLGLLDLLLVNGAPKTQHVSAIIYDLEGPESIARIGQFPMHGSVPAYELRVQ